MADLPTVPRSIDTADEAIQALRMALGMAIQVLASPHLYDDETKDHVQREAVATNLMTMKFDPRHKPATANTVTLNGVPFVNLVQPLEYLPDGTLPVLVLDGEEAEYVRDLLAKRREGRS